MASNLVKTEPIWSSGTTAKGEYLSSGDRKALFKKNKISSSTFKKSSAIVPVSSKIGLKGGAITPSLGSAITSSSSLTMDDSGEDNSLEQRVSNNERKITLLKNIIKAKDSYGGKETTLESIATTLEDIGNALTADFTHRITQKEQSLENLLEQSEGESRSDAEAGVEKTKKLQSTLGKTFDKVIAPAKGILSTLGNFFGTLLTGFIANKALKWLSKNPGLVTGFFKFLGDNMGKIAALIGGVLVFKLVRKIIGLYKVIRNVGRFMGGKPGIAQSRGTKPLGGGVFRKLDGSRRGITTTKKLAEGGGTVLKRSKSLAGKVFQQFDVGAKVLGRNLLKTIGAGPGKKTLMRGVLKFLRPLIKRIPFVGALIDFGLSVALGENPGRAAFGAIGAALLGAIGTVVGGPVGTLLGGLGGDWAGRKLYDLFFSGMGGEGGKTAKKMNTGGTVTGKDVGDKDSVPAMLTVGEKVIPREASRKFAPILDDMIKNNERGSWRDVLSNFKEEMRNDESIQEAHAVLKKTFKQISDDLRLPDSDDDVSILPPVREGSGASGGSDSNPAGGDSMPQVGPEDDSNPYISYYKEQLGIF